MNAPPPLEPPPAPVAPHWRHAFGGVWRLTLHRYLLPGRWMLVLGGLAVLSVLCLAASHHSDPHEYLEWAGVFHVTFLVPALAFVGAAGAMREELKATAVDYVFTRPIRRPAFVAGKFVAPLVGAQLDLLLALGVVVAVGAGRGIPIPAGALPTLLLGQALLVGAFGALGFLAGIVTSRYIILGLAYAGIVEAGLGQIPTQISRLSLTHQVRELLDSNPLTTGAALGVAGSLALFTLAALAAAAILLHHRELGDSPDS